jgi:hypothetical protein
VPGRAWRALLASVPTAAILSIVVTATPVLADCAALNAAFPPGNWSGRISNISTQDFDQLTVAVTDGFGAFDLFVDHDGSVQGTMSFQATGEAAMTDTLDEGSSSAQYLIAAEAAGTPTLVTLDGEIEMAVETVIDVHTADDDIDHYSHDGQDLYGSSFNNTYDWRSELEPRTQDCFSVSGEMTTPVGFDSDTVAWYAIRTDGVAKARINDIEGQLVNLLDQADRVMSMDPFDPWVLSNFLLDMLRFDGLLNSLEGCNTENVSTYGPAWDMLRSVSLNAMRTFLSQAEAGEYGTYTVIRAMTMFLQGGLLGWRGGEGCVTPTADEFAHEQFVRFEDLLLARWADAVESGNNADMRAIAYAAVQFGFPRLLAATQGGE